MTARGTLQRTGRQTYGGTLREWNIQARAAELEMSKVYAAAAASGATVVGDEILMTPEQRVEFDRLMAAGDAPPA